MNSNTKPQTTKPNVLDVWGARGPGGVVRSSISNYRAVAERWRDKRGPGYKLIRFQLDVSDGKLPDYEIVAKSPGKQSVSARKLGLLIDETTKSPTKKKAASKKPAAKAKKAAAKPKSRKAKTATPAARRKRVDDSSTTPETENGAVAL